MSELGLMGRRYTFEEASSSKCRFRNWWSILYPESAAEDWQEKLSSLGVQAFVSPLHDSDVNATGEEKKPHRHVLLMFQQVKNVFQVDEIFEEIGALWGFANDRRTCFQSVFELRGAARYLCHLDNPEKAQYDPKDVLAFGGADYFEICHLPKDDLSIVSEILAFCEEFHVVSYHQLLAYANASQPAWFKFLCTKGSRHIALMLKSLKWEIDVYGRVLPADPSGQARAEKEGEKD